MHTKARLHGQIQEYTEGLDLQARIFHDFFCLAQIQDTTSPYKIRITQTTKIIEVVPEPENSTLYKQSRVSHTYLEEVGTNLKGSYRQPMYN